MTPEYFRVGGLSGSSSLYFISKHFDTGLIIVPASQDLALNRETLSFFCQKDSPSGPLPKTVLSYSQFERVYEPVRQDPTCVFERIWTQWKILKSGAANKYFIITTLNALSQSTIPPNELLHSSLELKKGESIEREKLIARLQALGYRKDDLAEDQGFFSVRGHLIDIFSPYDEKPFRLEFFGDEIVSMRNFDTETQRSLDERDLLQILPCREIILTGEKWPTAKERLKNLGDEKRFPREEREKILSDLENQRDILEPRWLLPAFSSELVGLYDYLPKSIPTIFIDPEKAQAEFAEHLEEEDHAYSSLSRLAFEPKTVRSSVESLLTKPHHEIRSTISAQGQNYQVNALDTLRNQLLLAQSFRPLAERIRTIHEQTPSIEIVYQSNKRWEAMSESLSDVSRLFTWKKGPLFDGFASPTLQKAFITERDIFGVRRKKSSAVSRSAAEFLRQFSDLKDGDFVIHQDHGIGKFHGLQKLEIQGALSEFLVLEYAENDKLYLPIYRVEKLARYVSEGFANPRLDKLGSKIFQKRKAKIRKDILKIAHELLEVAATRKLNRIERPTSIDDGLYQKFCALFPYDLTSDQEAAIQEVEHDLKQDFPMDRLVCGDVGFGKTEVALRAAMLAVLQKRQVAVLAPTTILVEQHFRTFLKRFENFPVRVAHLSRFVSLIEQRQILDAMKDGKVDLVIGTHRLLQPDVNFKNLGLLVVDEEQRFGVKHKEKIKKVRATADVLTLSATPIPRTLQMAIFGIRELSLITTPPENRQAVKTYVGAFDDELIRKACLKEINRGGQVFLVHNRVQTIDKLADHIRHLIPNCRAVVAHGQMKDEQLEEKIVTFLEQKAEILISTSIIENGLDIPTANTLIVDHSELFGLSDLYQLRGRVGRSHVSANAYFLIHENTVLTDEASKRLQVIQSCTELGSGFHIATHDLEIRGSGNLLGEEQSGIIAEVGLELYSQLLQETLAEIKKTGASEPLTELNSGYTAYIPESYIPDASIRIATYKHLNRIKLPSDLLDFEDELLDRFGLPPKEVENLCQLTRLRTMAQALKAQSLDCFPGQLSLLLNSTTPLSPEKIIPLLSKNVHLDPKGRLSFSFKSALKNSELVEKSKEPELYDFSICRNFLKTLCEAAGVG